MNSKRLYGRLTAISFLTLALMLSAAAPAWAAETGSGSE
jgi:hypothetical protein